MSFGYSNRIQFHYSGNHLSKYLHKNPLKLKNKNAIGCSRLGTSTPHSKPGSCTRNTHVGGLVIAARGTVVLVAVGDAHACIHMYIHTHALMYICTCVHMYIQTNMYIYLGIPIYIYTNTYTHMCIKPYIRAYIHTYIHTYIHLSFGRCKGVFAKRGCCDRWPTRLIVSSVV